MRLRMERNMWLSPHARNKRTLPFEEQTINIIQRRPRIGVGNVVMDIKTETYKLTYRCEVTAILILYGLPSNFPKKEQLREQAVLHLLLRHQLRQNLLSKSLPHLSRRKKFLKLTLKMKILMKFLQLN